jgi:hypothetical protein
VLGRNWAFYNVGFVTGIVSKTLHLGPYRSYVRLVLDDFLVPLNGDNRIELNLYVDRYLVHWDVVELEWEPPYAACNLMDCGRPSCHFFTCNHLLCEGCFDGMDAASRGTYEEEVYRMLPRVQCPECRAQPLRYYAPIPSPLVVVDNGDDMEPVIDLTWCLDDEDEDEAN